MKKILALFIGFCMLSSLISCQKTATSDETKDAALDEVLVELIADFNSGLMGSGMPYRDYTYPLPKIAWKFGYCVMDKTYKFEFSDDNTAIATMKYTSYSSVEVAETPEAAQKLSEYTIDDTCNVEATLCYENNIWSVSNVRVFSEKDNEWRNDNVFSSPAIITDREA